MALESGTSLGPYQISEQIGAGGMGEVYKATDTRLNRTVAIKVLPAHFSGDAEMKLRFDREAKTVAGMNHPHICTLHDIGHAEIELSTEAGETATHTVDYLVMEYLAGESIADRLLRGPLPLKEALEIAVQIADGLEKAHAQGVTHRDLKPGNVMLTPSGAKLLDFGLAKLQQAPRADADAGVSGTLTDTAPGTVLGTMQYMAPEQLEGKEADARTDIFAFGAVLYEMITGRKAFEGKSQAHLIAAIVSTEPDPVSSQFPGIPRVLDFLIERCLEKDPEQRLQTATDLVWELRWIAGGGAEGGLPANLLSRPGRLKWAAPVALAGVVLLVGTLAALALFGGGDVEADNLARFVIEVPDMPVAEAVSISPDGRTVAYAARDGGTTAVFTRAMLVNVPDRLQGTEGAERLFWSPNSQSIGFFAGGQLKRVDAVGGAPRNIAETPDLFGASWNSSAEIIIFGSSTGLKRVSAAGGQPQPVSVSLPDTNGVPQEPYFLPDGRHFLFLVAPAPGSAEAGAGSQDGAIYVGSLDSPEVTHLVDARSNPVYADPGYLLYHIDGTLYAQPFDAGALSLEGDARRVGDGLPLGANGAAAFAASNTGVLLYRNNPVRNLARRGAAVFADGGSAGGIGAEPPLLWVDRQGQTREASEERRWIGVDLAPGGRQFAAHEHEAAGGDIWIFDEEVLTPTQFTFLAVQDNSTPIWSPDGTQIAFGSLRNGRWGLYLKAADRTQDEELVVESDLPIAPMSWTRSNELVYSVDNPQTQGDIWSVRAVPASQATADPVPFLATEFDERNPQVSPDGRWIAYSSNLTGRSEIYIQPFPEGPGQTRVSVNGGVFPRWRGDSRELYFMNLVSMGGMMASSITADGASIRREVPERLFQTFFISQPHSGGVHHAYAVSADGERFLIPQFDDLAGAFGGFNAVGRTFAAVAPAITADRRAGTSPGASSADPITVVVNWMQVLEER